MPPSHFALFMLPNQQTEEGATLLAGVVDPGYRGEFGGASPQGGQGGLWKAGDLPGAPTVALNKKP